MKKQQTEKGEGKQKARLKVQLWYLYVRIQRSSCFGWEWERILGLVIPAHSRQEERMLQ